jgi:glycosyltransferase involved in cell wall biosynthesis/uncharacterized SAM-binding protein YcdF (DUF218 family)
MSPPPVPVPGLPPRNWVIVSSINWSGNWQMHQQLATALVDAGHRVLFIENTGVRAPRRGDLGRIRDRLARWLSSTRGFSDVREHLTLLFPLVLPLPYSRVALAINRSLLAGTIRKWMTANRFHDPIVVSFLPTPLALALASELDPALLVYYCANDMSGGSEGASRLRAHEDRFMRRADAVFCTSSVLMERARQFNAQVHYSPAGVDLGMFAACRDAAPQPPADLAGLPRPIIGYVGSISAVFDQALLATAARAMPGASFVLVGPLKSDTAMLQACPNVHLLGSRPHDAVPHYLRQFDVGLIPYVRSRFTDAVYSCKLNEYLAMGLPVVATGMRELREFRSRHGDVLALVDTPDGLVAAIRAALAEDDPPRRQARIAAAEANTWDCRFAGLLDVVHKRLDDAARRPVRWQDRLRALARRGRLRALRTALGLGGAYLLLFHTPLPWLAAQPLLAQGRPEPADAIVVFATEGDPAYVASRYQQRAVDALALYRAGHAGRILITPNQGSALSQAEVVRSLLVGQGVPAAAVEVLNGSARSTADSVQLAAQSLRAQGARSALLVTAPYTAARARLVWQHLAPDLRGLDQAAVEGPPAQPVWRSSWSTTRAVAYEYAAIAYYWLKGWI